MKELEEFLKDNYPDGYIEHYLAMYPIHQDELFDENFKAQNEMYVAFEGIEEFQNLKNEIINAKQQADLNWFLKLAALKKIEGINSDNLRKMFEAIEKLQI